jgi:hypothetical protein
MWPVNITVIWRLLLRACAPINFLVFKGEGICNNYDGIIRLHSTNFEMRRMRLAGHVARMEEERGV